MDSSGYDIFVYKKKHLKMILAFAAVVFIIFPIKIYLHYKYHLPSYKNLFSSIALIYVFAALFYLWLSKTKMVIDGAHLIYEKKAFRSFRFTREKKSLGSSSIKNAEISKDNFDNYSITVNRFDDTMFHVMAKTRDANYITNWLFAECKGKVIDKGDLEKRSYKIGFMIVGALLLYYAFILFVIYLAT